MTFDLGQFSAPPDLASLWKENQPVPFLRPLFICRGPDSSYGSPCHSNGYGHLRKLLRLANNIFTM